MCFEGLNGRTRRDDKGSKGRATKDRKLGRVMIVHVILMNKA